MNLYMLFHCLILPKLDFVGILNLSEIKSSILKFFGITKIYLPSFKIHSLLTSQSEDLEKIFIIKNF